MGKSLRFFYLYGNEAEKFQFYKIPKTLIVNDYFSSVSTDAKLLYALFLDRAALSCSNNWIDDEGRVYIHYSTDTIMADMHCANGKVAKLKKELSDIGLIEIKRMGQGRPDRIYVMNFEPVLIGNQRENQESHFQKCENRISKNANIESLDMRISHANKTNDNQTEINHTNINQTEASSINQRASLQTVYNRPSYGGRYRRNSFHYSNERQYTKEDYDEMLRVAMTGSFV